MQYECGFTGLFTQMVWKDSKEFGIGKAKNKENKWIVVANYWPAGNVVGRHPENVFPAKDNDTTPIKHDEKKKKDKGQGRQDNDDSMKTKNHVHRCPHQPYGTRTI